MPSVSTYDTYIAGLKAKDRSCIVDLYDDYGSALYGVIRRIVTREEVAKEVLQDTFLKIWQRGDTYDPNQGRLFTWMMRIARNTALNRIDSKAYRQMLLRDSDETSEIQTSLSSSTTHAENTDLPEHIGRLETKYEEVIRLIYLQGYTHKEVSDHLGLPLGTVKSRVKGGLRRLREVYSYVSPSVSAIIGLLIIILT
ncbi:MAG: sigma-70 family RNA polymerase sigma factor [Bacteroidota bacterium]